MKLARGLLIAGLAITAAPMAHAQNWYMGAQMGLNMVTDAESGVPGTPFSDIEYDWGFGLLGQVGVSIADRYRIEGEIGWRRNSVDEFAGVNADGQANLFSFMVNGYYDIKTGTKWTPYIGAGVGGAVFDLGLNAMDDNDVTFAYQGIAGVAYRLNDNLSIKADYRYFSAIDPEFSGFESEYSHSVMVGFTWNFVEPKKAPPAAAPAATAPAPVPPPAPRNYMVFFDFDKADLTAEAKAILQRAANDIKSGNLARVSLAGHADRSGADAYNMKLSQRRVDAVKAYLVSLGVSGSAIAVSAKGESAPLVPTADGVREPQNRRVEIVLP